MQAFGSEAGGSHGGGASRRSGIAAEPESRVRAQPEPEPVLGPEGEPVREPERRCWAAQVQKKSASRKAGFGWSGGRIGPRSGMEVLLAQNRTQAPTPSRSSARVEPLPGPGFDGPGDVGVAFPARGA